MRYFYQFCLSFCTAFLLVGCSFSTQKVEISTPKQDEVKSHYAKLDFDQNLSKLAKVSSSFLQDPSEYKKQFFAPWHINLNQKFNKEALFWSFEGYLNPANSYFYFSKIPIEKEFFQKAVQNANVEAFMSVKQKALVVKNTPLRNLPTTTQVLKNPFKDSEGVPFDYTLDSVLNAGSAVFISHFSKDKKFAFVKAESGWGFVEANALEIFTEKRTQIYEKLHFITPLKERLSVYDSKGEFLFEARVGALYPYYKSDESYYYGKIGQNLYKFPKEFARDFPLPFNDENLKLLMNELLAKPYGWGGYDFERDCSLLMRDIFAAFGIFLPRNSRTQSLAWRNYDISFLNDAQKQEFIAKFAKPYQSLLYLRGHIVLYVGQFEGQNAIYHSIWGVRTKDNGRLLVAKTALTPLDIGKDEDRADEKGLILSRISTLSILSLSEAEQGALEAELSRLRVGAKR